MDAHYAFGGVEVFDRRAVGSAERGPIGRRSGGVERRQRACSVVVDVVDSRLADVGVIGAKRWTVRNSRVGRAAGRGLEARKRSRAIRPNGARAAIRGTQMCTGQPTVRSSRWIRLN